MRILVCVKHVYDTTGIRLDPVTGEPLLAAAPTKISDYDRHAVEEAARLRQQAGAAVTLLGIGPAEAARTLKEALAMGADEGLLVTAPPEVLADPAATAHLLAAAARHAGPFDLILCGDVSEDGYHGLVPGMVAARLGAPHVGGVASMAATEDGATVTRLTEDAVETYRLRWPAVVSVSRAINEPRFVTAIQVMRVPMSRIRVKTPADVGVDEPALAAEQATRLVSVRPTDGRKETELLTGASDDVVARLVAALEEKELLR
jgi:electron transfer flavoprotein beta subunit